MCLERADDLAGDPAVHGGRNVVAIFFRNPVIYVWQRGNVGVGINNRYFVCVSGRDTVPNSIVGGDVTPEYG